MDNVDGWDWPWLYFLGTYVFRLSEERFWRLTPRQLFTLTSEYEKYHGDKDSGSSSSSNKNSNQPVYIDQLF